MPDLNDQEREARLRDLEDSGVDRLREGDLAAREDTERPAVIPGDHPETRKLAEMMREDTERPEEVTRLREGLERALDVSFIVGLLRVRAGKTDDAELAEWGERLKGQLVAIREVLSPGTAAAMAELRDTGQEHER